MNEAVRYQGNFSPHGAIATLMRSGDMMMFMLAVGSQGVTIARSYSPTPNMIRSQSTTSMSRYCVNILNEAPDAFTQEFGGKGKPPVAPLGRVLSQLWAQDPYRRKGSLARIR